MLQVALGRADDAMRVRSLHRTRAGGSELVAECETSGHSKFDEASIVARVTRYSSLRGVERALLPSVRSRARLPTTHVGPDILSRLQGLLAHARAPESAESGGPERSRRELLRVDAALAEIALALTGMIEDTPIAQLRSTLPPLVDRSRTEVSALLDLYLESFAADETGDPPFKVDFLVTLLAKQRAGDVAKLGCDPCMVTPGVSRLCAVSDSRPDARSPELSRSLRDAQIALLDADDLEGIIEQVRHLKGRLGACLFDRDVLRAIVAYNLAAENRFHEIFQLVDRKDAAIERALAGQPERPENDEPHRVDAHPSAHAETDRSTDAGAGPTDAVDPRNVIERATTLLGVAQRELPGLTQRLRELEDDAVPLETGWLGELEAALYAATEALGRSGDLDPAARVVGARSRSAPGR